jgi:3'5'-cyclic nucleotide phosphodiesterase
MLVEQQYIPFYPLDVIGRKKHELGLNIFLSRLSDFHSRHSGYCRFKNPYHNNLHAADVAQTVHHVLCQTGLMHWLTDLEIFATLVAALIHDYEHTGTTNNFHGKQEH